MKRRFIVTREDRQIASVVAESAEEAIRIACKKTGTNPDGCAAVEASAVRPPDHFLR